MLLPGPARSQLKSIEKTGCLLRRDAMLTSQWRHKAEEQPHNSDTKQQGLLRISLPPSAVSSSIASLRNLWETECKAGPRYRIGLHTAIAAMDESYDLAQRDDGALGEGTTAFSPTLALQAVLQFRMKDPLDPLGNGSLRSHRLFLSSFRSFRCRSFILSRTRVLPHGSRSQVAFFGGAVCDCDTFVLVRRSFVMAL